MAKMNSIASFSTDGLDTSASTSAKAQIPRKENVYNIRVVNNPDTNYKVMSFNRSANINFTDWKKVQLERTNKLFKAYRRQKEKLFMTVKGKEKRTFKSVRRAIHDDNSSYYILKRTPDGTVEAYPMDEWHHFRSFKRRETKIPEIGQLTATRNMYSSIIKMYKLSKRKEGEIPKLSKETETEWKDIDVEIISNDEEILTVKKEEDEYEDQIIKDVEIVSTNDEEILTVLKKEEDKYDDLIKTDVLDSEVIAINNDVEVHYITSSKGESCLVEDKNGSRKLLASNKKKQGNVRKSQESKKENKANSGNKSIWWTSIPTESFYKKKPITVKAVANKKIKNNTGPTKATMKSGSTCYEN